MPSPNKLTDRDENPVDRLLLKLSMDSLPFWYRTGHTANTLTTYKCIFGLLAWYNLRMRRVMWFGGFAIISYFFDCADGQMARTYGMVSNFGDRYDLVHSCWYTRAGTPATGTADAARLLPGSV